MRSGYLAALAARTLGTAPLLRPATPGRFEPDGPTGRLEFLEISDPGYAPTEAEPAVRPASSSEEPGSRAALLSGEPLLPAVEPDAPLLPDTSAAAEPASGVASARASESDTAPRAITELVRQIAVEAQLAEPVVAAGAAQPVERAGRRSERARDDAVSGERGHATMPPPAPVVVHIGRIDVRAAEPAPRTVLPPRQPPVQAGRTLADHLLARDRELS